MIIIILYASKGRSGRIVAEEIQSKLNISSTLYCLNDTDVRAQDLTFDWMFLISPTYGDGELEIAMEKFLVNSSWKGLKNKTFSVCELGLYRGYDLRTMGAGPIMDGYLAEQGLVRKGNILSLDSVPLSSLFLVEKWLKKLR